MLRGGAIRSLVMLNYRLVIGRFGAFRQKLAQWHPQLALCIFPPTPGLLPDQLRIADRTIIPVLAVRKFLPGVGEEDGTHEPSPHNPAWQEAREEFA